jgi:O-antigen ligase
MRRVADALLVFTAASVPLSISGMQIGIVGLVALAVLGTVLGAGVVRRTPLDGVLGLLFGILALSTLASGRPLEADGWSRPWVVIGFYAVFWWLRDRAQARRFAIVMVAAGTVAALYGILQHFTGVDWWRAALGRPTRVRPRIAGAEGFAVVGFFRNYLTFAHVMIFPLAWALAAALRGRVLGMLAAAAMVAAIAFSTARGVWVGAVVGVVVLAAVGRGGRGLPFLAGLVAVAALAFALSPGLRQQAAPIFTLGGENAQRVAIYQANRDIIAEHPLFGLGFGRYRVAGKAYYEPYPQADRKSHAHNNFLQIAAEAGLLGLAAFCLLFAWLLRLGWGAMRAAPDADTWITATGAWLGIVVFLIAGLTQYNFGDNEVAIGMWCAAAVLLRCREA